jgi:MFS superfamily sulfate permease-like transporter
MGGCAMIGQSMINVGNGARGRLSGICASLFLLSFILFGASVIERIPLAALIGVMFVVCEKTFEWGTFRLFGKVPRADALVVVLVAGVTLVFNLATAVLVGVIVSALVFAWQHAKQIRVATAQDANGWKVYELEGTLFFASVAGFQALFAPKDDPQDVVVEFRRARVADHSAIQAIDGAGGTLPRARQTAAPAPPEPGLPRAARAREGHDRGEPAGRPALSGRRRQVRLTHALAHALHVRVGIRLRAVALRRPDHLAQTFHDAVVRLVLAHARGQRLVGGADAARLVDRHLFRDRQVHRQVQERIRLAAFDGVIARHRRIRVRQLVVVFGMLFDPVGGDGVHRGQDLAGAALAVGFAKEAADVVGRGGEHGENRRKTRRKGVIVAR